MLKSQYRIKNNIEIRKVTKLGKRAGSAFFSLKTISTSIKNPRFAIITDLKVSKKAVERNRLRRQISEIIRISIANFYPGHDVVIWASQKAVGKDYQDIEKDLMWLFHKAELVR